MKKHINKTNVLELLLDRIYHRALPPQNTDNIHKKRDIIMFGSCLHALILNSHQCNSFTLLDISGLSFNQITFGN